MYARKCTDVPCQAPVVVDTPALGPVTNTKLATTTCRRSTNPKLITEAISFLSQYLYLEVPLSCLERELGQPGRCVSIAFAFNATVCSHATWCAPIHRADHYTIFGCRYAP